MAAGRYPSGLQVCVRPCSGIFYVPIYHPALCLLGCLFVRLLGSGKHLVQALLSMYGLQCLTGEVGNKCVPNDLMFVLLECFIIYINANYSY